MLDPFSIAVVSIAALSSAGIKNLASSVWDRLLSRMTGKREITITSPSGQQVRIKAAESMTEDRIKEILSELKVADSTSTTNAGPKNS